MPKYRITTIAQLLGVSDDTVRRWLSEGHISTAHTASGPKMIDGASVVKFLHNKPEVFDQSNRLQEQSIRNSLPGLVTKIESDKVMSSVHLQCGPYKLVSLISTEAVKDLGLEVGSVASADIKATNVSLSVNEGKYS